MRYLYNKIDRTEFNDVGFVFLQPYLLSNNIFKIRNYGDTPTVIRNSVSKMTRMDLTTGIGNFSPYEGFMYSVHIIPIYDYIDGINNYNILLQTSELNCVARGYKVHKKYVSTNNGIESHIKNSFKNILIPNTDFYIGIVPNYNPDLSLMTLLSDIYNSGNILYFGGKYNLHSPYLSTL
jgi:hypothetical protein